MNQHIKNIQISKIYEEWVYKTFPKCFDGSFRPLSLGIFQELVEQLPEELSKRQLRRFIHWYTNQIVYTEAFFHNDFRVNLDGSDATEIDSNEKEQAQIRLIGIYMRKEIFRENTEEAHEQRKAATRLEFLKKIAKKNQKD